MLESTLPHAAFKAPHAEEPSCEGWNVPDAGNILLGRLMAERHLCSCQMNVMPRSDLRLPPL